MTARPATTRVVADRTREPWTVEEATRPGAETVVLRYRHELGYEIVTTARKRLAALSERELVRILEDARHRLPKQTAVDAA